MAFVIGNRIKVATGTTGTGTVTLSTTAEDGFQNFANGGIANSDVVRYTIEDGTDFEIGNGTYNSGTSTLTRTLLESSTGSLLNLSGDAIVFITAAAEDLQLKDSSGNISVSGNIAVTGTVDGRDLATDGTKLDGIETGATADQTKADIDALGIDADTVDGLEASQFLRSDTDDTMIGSLGVSQNLTADAGNLIMGDDAYFASQAYVGMKTNFMSGSNDYMIISGITSDGSTYISAKDGDSVFIRGGGNYATSQIAVPDNGVPYIGTTDTDIIWHAGNDGDGSGLDADLLDGVQGSNYFRTDITETTRSFQPEAGNTYDIGGGTSNYYRYGYFNRLYYGAWYNVSDTSDRIQWGAISAVQIFFNNSEEFRFTDTGVLHADNNVIAYSSTISDERLKYDINKIGNALDKVSELSGYTFKYKHRDRLSGGVIAQEVEKVLPEAISEQDLPLQTDDGEKYKTVNYNAIQGLLIEAVKELKTQVQDLKAEIEELKNASSN